MDKQKLQPFLDKMKIISKDECPKWDMKRWHYIIKIGDEVFNYYGSAKEFEDEKRCLDFGVHNLGTYANYKCRPGKNLHTKQDYENDMIKKGMESLKIKLQSDDEVKTDALYCLIMDYGYGDYDLADFIEEMGYDGKRLREGIKIHKEIQINKQRMDNVFTRDEIELLTDLYSDY